MGPQPYTTLLLISGWTILISLLYDLTSHWSSRQPLRVGLALLLSALISLAGWETFKTGAFVQIGSIFNLADPAFWQAVFICLWLVIGWLFSRAFDEAISCPLRLLLGLILSFAVTHYFIDMLRMVYFP